VDQARAELRRQGLPDVAITYVNDWHTHDGFIEANADRVREAMASLPAAVHERAELVFTAHSIPVSMADRYPYRQQFEETASLIAARVNASRPPEAALDFVAVYQSRSGRPEDPWLGPDVCDYLRGMQSRRATAAILSPAGFLVDHVEVLYDLDVEGAAVAREIGLPIARAGTAGVHPRFLDMLADVVQATARRYDRGAPVPLVALQS
jgi:ferrochelatase